MLLFRYRHHFGYHYILRSLKIRMGPTTMKTTEEEITIPSPWGKIKALTWGKETDPPVLLCHGKMDVASSFRPLVKLLPNTFFYVSVDLPGNGRSDHFPPKSRFTIADFVPTIHNVAKHFEWDKFIYIGHSLGALIGKYYNLAYPGRLSRVVELDPVPMCETWPPESFGHWYHQFYGDFYGETYAKVNSGVETAPRYTYEKALNLMMGHRGLTEHGARTVLERCLTPVGGDLYRFTYDQRLKEIPRLPLSPEYMKQLYTSIETPTYTFLSKAVVELGAYHFVPFVLDESEYPHGNYRVKTVEGTHDIHLNNPEFIAGDISKFMLEELELRAKL